MLVELIFLRNIIQRKSKKKLILLNLINDCIWEKQVQTDIFANINLVI